MFDVVNDTIMISRGDTGAIRFRVNAKYRGTEDPYTFGANDRAVFSIKNASGAIVKEKVSPITDNAFVVTFFNTDTDSLAEGSYSWDTRYVINPYYSGGRIVDGDQVITPKPPQTMNLLKVVGDI